MNIKKKLSNPFALVAQGFALGAILVVASAPTKADSPAQAAPARSAAIAAPLEA